MLEICFAAFLNHKPTISHTRYCRKNSKYADLEGGIVKDIGLDDVHVLETCDGSVEVGGPGGVADDSEDSCIRPTRLRTKE